MKQKIDYSFLDTATIGENRTIKETLNNVLKTAQEAENLGYSRFWLAEHHNMANIASSATSVLIGYVAQGTSKIRVGSGGIMLPNHSSLVIAEQFGTLEALYPGRIDLGLGRAPGTDQLTAMALRRNTTLHPNGFMDQIKELESFFKNTDPSTTVRAFPGEGAKIDTWILGSSTDSAYLAAELGLPYAFASHFAPNQLQLAAKIYRKNFKPSEYLKKPYFIACVNAILADDSDQANILATSFYKMFLGIIRNDRNPLQEPAFSMQGIWSESERDYVLDMTACSFIGSKEELLPEVQRFCDILEIDELMIHSPIYDIEAKQQSITLFSELMQNVEKNF